MDKEEFINRVEYFYPQIDFDEVWSFIAKKIGVYTHNDVKSFRETQGIRDFFVLFNDGYTMYADRCTECGRLMIEKPDICIDCRMKAQEEDMPCYVSQENIERMKE